MATVVHPVFPDQKRVVPDDDLKKWTDAGWNEGTGDAALPEDTNLTSFEEALLEQQADSAPEPAVSFQPTLDEHGEEG